MSGAFSTLAVGLFANKDALLYGGGMNLLLSQLIGVIAIFVWAYGQSLILFELIKTTIGLRETQRIEEEGLDV